MSFQALLGQVMEGKRQSGFLYPLLATGAGTAFPDLHLPAPALLHLEKPLKEIPQGWQALEPLKRLVLHSPGLVT